MAIQSSAPAVSGQSTTSSWFNGEWLTTSTAFNGVWLTTRIMPAARALEGGDWCESFAISPRVIALSIGDVCGHGIDKSNAMFTMRQTIRDTTYQGRDPAQTLAEANRCLHFYNSEETATAIVALLDTQEGSLVFANAGHPPPLMIGPDDSTFLRFPNSDLPLGIEGEILPSLRTFRVPAAALIVLYTDGVTERTGQPLLGEMQLHDAADFAYFFSNLPTANFIEKQMLLTGTNRDDAAILAARMPRAYKNVRPL